MSSQVLSISKDGDSKISLGKLIFFDHLHSKKCFLMFTWNFLHFKACSLLLVLSLSTTGRSFVPFPLLPTSGVYKRWRDPPWAFSSPSWTVPACSASPCALDASTPSSPSRPFTGPAPVCPHLSCTGEPRPGPSAPDVPHQRWAEKGHLPQLLPALPLLQPRVPLAACAARVHCWLKLTLTHHAWCILACTSLYVVFKRSVPNYLPGTGTQLSLSHRGWSRLETTGARTQLKAQG